MVILLVVYFFGFFIDITRDSAKYAFIAREMTEKNHWLFLTILDEPYTQKPPFMFWLSSISFRLFGISNLSYKLPIFLYSLIGIYAVYQLSKTMYGTKTGKLAVLALATSAIMILYSMDIHTDTVLFTNVSLSLWLLYLYLEKNKISYLIAAGVALGLSILTKGIFGLLVPGFAVIGYVASKKQWKKLINPKWLILIITVIIASLPVLIPLYIRNGFEGIRFFIWDNNYGRVIGKYNGIINDPTFYIHTLIYLFLPWSIVFFAGIVSLYKSHMAKVAKPADRFILWGFIGFFFVLTLSKNKLPNYLMCVLPLASIIIARGWKTFFSKEGKTTWKKVNNFFLNFIWLIMLVSVFVLFPEANLLFWILFILLFAIYFWMLWIKTKETFPGIFPTLLTGVAIGILVNLNIAEKLFENQAAVYAAGIINDLEKPDVPVYYFNPDNIDYQNALINFEVSEADSMMNEIFLERHFYLNYELLFYTKQPSGYIDSLKKLDEICQHQKPFIYTNENGKNMLFERYNERELSVTPIPDFNPAYPFSYLLQKTGRMPLKTMYLIKVKSPVHSSLSGK